MKRKKPRNGLSDYEERQISMIRSIIEDENNLRHAKSVASSFANSSPRRRVRRLMALRTIKQLFSDAKD